MELMTGGPVSIYDPATGKRRTWRAKDGWVVVSDADLPTLLALYPDAPTRDTADQKE